MDPNWNDIWQIRTNVYSFFATSLLKIVSGDPSTTAGLDPKFWQEFPIEPLNSHISQGIKDLTNCTKQLANLPRDKAIERVAVEYTKLFIGPGTPAAPPWETLYQEGATVLFGQPTFDIKALLAKHGLKASADSHQLEDHLGIELFYIVATSDGFTQTAPTDQQIQEQLDFLGTHPLSFIQQLQAKAKAASVVGYYPALLELIWGFLLWDQELLKEYLRT
ncbi:dehydrogenase [Actinomycetota bacterium]|nr:dehydrogenase [Actinomycetota bacterium]